MLFDDIPERIQRIYRSSTPDEQKILMQILQELSDSDRGYSSTYTDIWLADYKEIPVDIDTFLCDDMYLGKTNRNGAGVYPFWKQELHTVFDAGNKYWEWILTGATRIGKTSTFNTGMSYMLYRLMCLKDPQKFFGKKEISTFSVLFFNLTEELAKGVAFREFNDTLRESPWFLAHGDFTRSRDNPIYLPEGGKIDVDFGSSSAHALGKQVFCCAMDEINFSQAGIKDVAKAKARMRETYNTLAARVKGTFKHGGEVFGKIFAASSKRSDSDFMEDYIAEQMAAGAGEHMHVSGAPQWEVLPPGTFSEKRFYIAVGDRHHKGFVIPDNQTHESALNDLRKQGYTLMEPPVDMKSDFIANFEIALRDLAGVAVPGTFSYITQAIVTQCITDKRRNPFYQDILEIGVHDVFSIEEFFHMEELTPEIKRMPLYIHLDLSLNKDRAGISGAGIIGRKDMDILVNGQVKTMSMPIVGHAFSVAIQAPRDDKIPYDKVFKFILWLRRNGLHIQVVSRDQFQSEYLGQLLDVNGFKEEKISLDRTPDGYIALRSLLDEQRVEMLDVQLLQDELVHLQEDSISGKIDHLSGQSKDVSDSFAGAVWQAVRYNEGVAVSKTQVASAIKAVNAMSRVNSKPTPRFPSLGSKFKIY